jgi:hypothetical protein
MIVFSKGRDLTEMGVITEWMIQRRQKNKMEGGMEKWMEGEQKKERNAEDPANSKVIKRK